MTTMAMVQVLKGGNGDGDSNDHDDGAIELSAFTSSDSDSGERVAS